MRLAGRDYMSTWLGHPTSSPYREAGVLQNVAWKIADQLGWPDTFDAEYVALTQLQANAFITLDAKLAPAVKDLVTIAPQKALS